MSDSITNTFEEVIGLNYQLYNGLFLTLPLDAVEKTGLLLPLLEAACEEGLQAGKNPTTIIEEFFELHKPHFETQDKINFLFKVIQYVERQVVLVDALEDAAYKKMHQVEKLKVLRTLTEKVDSDDLHAEFSEVLSNFGIRVTLTAHPTQFYPGAVLAIINDLTRAISRNDISTIRDLLQQLGNTPFSRKEQPTPYDEAVLLSWYLGNIFYPVMGQITDNLAGQYEEVIAKNKKLMTVGFWPGGDRDGNPFVTVQTTRRVAAKLRYSIAACYHSDVRDLKRRLTFTGIYSILEDIERQLHDELSETKPSYSLTTAHLIAKLDEIETLLLEKNQGLYIEQLRSFRRKVNLFGFYFASLDIRQDSRVIHRAFNAVAECNPSLIPDLKELDEAQEVDVLLALSGDIDISSFDEPILQDTLKSFPTIRDIQTINGEQGCHRYIISNCHGPIDMARAYALFHLCGWKDKSLSVDIVPLFESIDDLRNAGEYMRRIYATPIYREHLSNRGNQQTVMLGFSDGTKDGGYLMANWAIYRAKEELTAASREAGIEVSFFDGRGGPTARGGGNAYLFYAALGKKIESNQIQMTVQGQTISSHYGVKPAAQHNLSLLLAAGLENNLYDRPERELNQTQSELIGRLAATSLQKYQSLKQHDLFIPYLEEISTLNYYNLTNIGSRPARRGDSCELKFEDLRAIPFVGAWAQLKQNVPGYYGLGTALNELDRAGQLDHGAQLYKDSGFFRALILNAMQNLAKTNFELTRYMETDEKFGEFWKMIFDEYELTLAMVLKVAGQEILLQDSPRARLSIELREQIVLPLLVTQQYALMKIQKLRSEDAEGKLVDVYEKMVVRSLYGNINASRNSV
ncbi:MAG: phosphoenolpyruvate carboxylase [SAR86 cluster bacterium]|uniref:Phosphoenolpyruvate carboxylase n=1 Tax=SAR86 cluster bacterium TaxID=2030880 RepID=A0A2A5B200_9GAMM|nr:MAG: phosphoenolpyruvate carboxylase [SAR86 cluster bacterium]